MRATDEGFILPTTLLVMVLLTVMLTAAFILASAEFRATDNTLASNRALSLAQAGLENYFSLPRSLDTGSTYDSIRISFANGYADVVGQRVRAATGGHFPLWLIRSIGTSTDPRQPGQSQGQRAVAQMAELNSGLIPARAALTAVNGIMMIAGSSTANPIIGTDNNYGSGVTNCTKPAGSAADTAAYTIGSVPQSFTGSLSATGTGYSHSGSGGALQSVFSAGMTIIASGFSNAANNGVSTVVSVNGNTMTVSKTPATTAEGSASGRNLSVTPGNYLGGSPLPTGSAEALPSIGAAYDSSHIDWQRVLDGDFTPDYISSWPPTCSGSACAYSSYYWTGSQTVPTGTRRGLLVVTGDVTLSAGVHWDGIIIAGGSLMAVPGTSNSYKVHGMVVTGLNCGTSVGCPATQDSIQRGPNNQINWDWCYTHAAIGGLNGLVPLRNTWVDQWSLY